jgi:hypothetical protein
VHIDFDICVRREQRTQIDVTRALAPPTRQHAFDAVLPAIDKIAIEKVAVPLAGEAVHFENVEHILFWRKS